MTMAGPLTRLVMLCYLTLPTSTRRATNAGCDREPVSSAEDTQRPSVVPRPRQACSPDCTRRQLTVGACGYRK